MLRSHFLLLVIEVVLESPSLQRPASSSLGLFVCLSASLLPLTSVHASSPLPGNQRGLAAKLVTTCTTVFPDSATLPHKPPTYRISAVDHGGLEGRHFQ
jgi:hypothetical protein